MYILDTLTYYLTFRYSYLFTSYYDSVAARGCLPPGTNVFVAAPSPAIRSPIDIFMVTTMALVWTVNGTLSWGCNYVMQWNLGWSVADAKKLLLTLPACVCVGMKMYVTLYAESVLQCKRQFARNGQISEFHIYAALNAAPAQYRPGRIPPPPSFPFPRHYYDCRRSSQWWCHSGWAGILYATTRRFDWLQQYLLEDKI